ncbi:MAG: lytic transglycosylase domain-containing protein [Zoogloeaceae bacterium]|jgi:soluble lytic murein transglycosylase|nr:lytic transglycosylase domain-containing protein [Zoogloeaceae bacterium]
MEMKRFFCLIGLALCLPLAAQAQTQPAVSAADQTFLDARDAFRAGNAGKLATLSAALPKDYPLAAYLDYWRLRQNLDDKTNAEINAFAEAQSGHYLGERITADWQKTQVHGGDYAQARRLFARLANPDQEARCLEMLSRQQLSDFTAKPEAENLWLTLVNNSEGCRWFLEDQEKRVSEAQFWQRARYLLEEAKTAQLKNLIADRLPPEPNKRVKKGGQWAIFTDKPALWLARYIPNSPKHPALDGDLRQLAVLAIGRMARSDPQLAAEELARWKALSNDDKEWLWAQVGLWGARYHKPFARSAFAKAAALPLTTDAAEWRVRAALRAKDWPGVKKAIDELPGTLASRPAWVYWQARALEAAGDLTNARALFAHLADGVDFYGILSAEELKKPFVLPSAPVPPSDAEMAEARANPGLQRAVKFFALGLRLEGVREWNWTIRGMDDRHLLAAAHFALENQLFDRAINTAEKTLSEHDFSLRYLAPFEQEVKIAVEKQALDPAWVYGLMRQESRFIMNAKSSAGASGLMQLMPKTARWVAKKIGLEDYHHGKVNDMDVNLLLGTSYMRMVMENLHDHPVLASAAYNAGPGRAQRWKANAPLEAAIYIETIPFDETRDYVQKVMANTFIYTRIFGQPDQPLKSLIATVPSNTAERLTTPDLP